MTPDLRKAAKYKSLSSSQIVLFILFLDRCKKQKAPMQAVKEASKRLSATRYVLSTMHKIYLGFLTWLASACPGKSEIHQQPPKTCFTGQQKGNRNTRLLRFPKKKMKTT